MAKPYITESDTTKWSSWVRYNNGINTSMYVEKAGYFDERPRLYTSVTQLLMLVAIPMLVCLLSWWFLLMFPLIFVGYGELRIYLPIRTGLDQCDSPHWGTNYHDDIFWLYTGDGDNCGKSWIAYFAPWSMKWHSTTYKLKDGSTFTEYHDYRHVKNRCRNKDKTWDLINGLNISTDIGEYLRENSYRETFKFNDICNDTIVDCEVYGQTTHHRRKGLMWLNLFSRTGNRINLEFSDEVGPEKGNWKGGILATSYHVDSLDNFEKHVRAYEQKLAKKK